MNYLDRWTSLFLCDGEAEGRSSETLEVLLLFLLNANRHKLISAKRHVCGLLKDHSTTTCILYIITTADSFYSKILSLVKYKR